MTQTTDLLDEARKLVPETLYVTDAELIRRLGVPEKIARRLIRSLDANPATRFPKKEPLCAGRRYWPAVKAFFDGLSGSNPQAPRGRGL